MGIVIGIISAMLLGVLIVYVLTFAVLFIFGYLNGIPLMINLKESIVTAYQILTR